MKRKLFFGIVGTLISILSLGQDKKVYTTTSGEWIFSFAAINANGVDRESAMRYSPVINVQNWINIDQSEHLGFFTGLSFRNVGFIYDETASVRKKIRTYNAGIPVGIKIGNLDNIFFFAGYELEIPFNYKEKTFTNEDKTSKFNVWFSKRTPTFSHSLMAGVKLPAGAAIKFKYYLTDFYRKGYTEADAGGNVIRPYENFNVNVFYFSVSFTLFRNTDFYYVHTNTNTL